jgi:YidC/Oxa1 family membrane protein insertase
MEQMRVLIAIALSFLVFFLWSVIFPGKKPESPAPEKQPQAQVEKPVIATEATKPVEKIEKKAFEARTEVVSGKTARLITIDTPFFRAIISEKGAVIKSLVLKHYRETVEKDSPLKELVASEVDTKVTGISFADGSVPALKGAIFSTSRKEQTITINQDAQDLRFEWTSPRGITFQKIYTFSPNSYLIGLNVVINNQSKIAIRDRFSIGIEKYFESSKNRFGFEGPSAYINNSLEQVKVKKIKEHDTMEGDIEWLALQDRYFMSSIIPQEDTVAIMKMALLPDNRLVSNYIMPVYNFDSGSRKNYKFDLFLGPKSMKVLSGFDNNLKKSINFGWFDILAKPCLWFMNFIYDNVVGNYGIAIIIITIVSKLILWPLGSKSYKSMNEMKKLQPLMTELREKYKGDKQRMNQELMALYKTYKINPMGGCLPMVVQMPVFFALYRMLYEAIELRHAPFFLWINDLAAPDRLFHFDISIPFMQPPIGIPVLTLIMGATMILQQKMTPSPGDPTQAKMMMLMPVIFTAIFVNFSSGLVLYWLFNNLLSIGQQYYIAKKSA